MGPAALIAEEGAEVVSDCLISAGGESLSVPFGKVPLHGLLPKVRVHRHCFAEPKSKEEGTVREFGADARN